MTGQPTQEQKDELDGCIAVGGEIAVMEREQKRLQDKHDVDKKHFTADDERQLNTCNTYLPNMRNELQYRKTQILMRGIEAARETHPTSSEQVMALAIAALPTRPMPFGSEQCVICGAVGTDASLKTVLGHEENCAYVTAFCLLEGQEPPASNAPDKTDYHVKPTGSFCE